MNKQDFIKNHLFKFTGCGCQGECPTTKSEDNLYLIGLVYYGRYEDDDCYFSYVNAETGEINTNSWTTRGACPGFQSYLRPTVQTAVENGWLSQEWVDNYVADKWRSKKIAVIEELTGDLHHITEVFEDVQLSLPVEISSRCRKFKEPTGILLSAEKVKIPYSWNNYEVQAKVLGSNRKIYTININNCSCKALEEIRKELFNRVDDINDTKEICEYIANYNHVDIADCVDVKEEKAKAKREAFKAQKMPELVEWCRGKAPEKSEEELVAWAEKIFNRKY